MQGNRGAFSEIKVNLKWPNDIFINKKKIGGILIETLYKCKNPNKVFAFVGVGINIKSPAYNKPNKNPDIKDTNDSNIIDQPFTDLTTEVLNKYKKEVTINKDDIIISILKNINNYMEFLTTKDQGSNSTKIKEYLIKRWNQKDQYFKQKVLIKTKVNGDYKIIEGIHNGITNKGEIKLKIEQKKTILIRDGSIISYYF